MSCRFLISRHTVPVSFSLSPLPCLLWLSFSPLLFVSYSFSPVFFDPLPSFFSAIYSLCHHFPPPSFDFILLSIIPFLFASLPRLKSQNLSYYLFRFFPSLDICSPPLIPRNILPAFLFLIRVSIYIYIYIYLWLVRPVLMVTNFRIRD